MLRHQVPADGRELNIPFDPFMPRGIRVCAAGLLHVDQKRRWQTVKRRCDNKK
jgi:hypothetical protein